MLAWARCGVFRNESYHSGQQGRPNNPLRCLAKLMGSEWIYFQCKSI